MSETFPNNINGDSLTITFHNGDGISFDIPMRDPAWKWWWIQDGVLMVHSDSRRVRCFPLGNISEWETQ